MKRLLLFLVSLIAVAGSITVCRAETTLEKIEPERNLHHRHPHRVATVCLCEQEQRVGRVLDRSRGNIDLAVDLQKAQQANQAGKKRVGAEYPHSALDFERS